MFSHFGILCDEHQIKDKMTSKKRTTQWLPVLLALAAPLASLCSCSNDDDEKYLYSPTALVTVCTKPDNSFFLQLDDSTTLHPTNITQSPFGGKEVRALVNYSKTTHTDGTYINQNCVFINWIDSIRTKMPVEDKGDENDKLYGNDAIEIVKDWVTVAEDGYLTMRIRTRWGNAATTHSINLLTGSNPNAPYELELRHNAYGDTYGKLGDALIAFNLNNLPHKPNAKVNIKLTWNSFYGKKTTEFKLQTRPSFTTTDIGSIKFIRNFQ